MGLNVLAVTFNGDVFLHCCKGPSECGEDCFSKRNIRKHRNTTVVAALEGNMLTCIHAERIVEEYDRVRDSNTCHTREKSNHL